MSIIEKMSKIVNDGDVAAGEKLIHDAVSYTHLTLPTNREV